MADLLTQPERRGGLVGTIIRMRRTIIVLVLALVVAGMAWALWPATRWPSAFCVPVVKVAGADADAIANSFTHHPSPALTTTQLEMVATLRADVRRAEVNAPTSQLRTELNRYLTELNGKLTNLTVSDALSRFDEGARTQLRACGLRPAGG